MPIQLVMEKMIDDLLLTGCDDWIHIADLIWTVSSIGGATTKSEIREMVINIVREVLLQGLVTIGDVKKDGYHDWGITMDEALERMKERWDALNRQPLTGDICWLEITKKGIERARTSEGTGALP